MCISLWMVSVNMLLTTAQLCKAVAVEKWITIETPGRGSRPAARLSRPAGRLARRAGLIFMPAAGDGPPDRAGTPTGRAPRLAVILTDQLPGSRRDRVKRGPPARPALSDNTRHHAGDQDARQGRDGSERDDGQDVDRNMQDLGRGRPAVLCQSLPPSPLQRVRTPEIIGADVTIWLQLTQTVRNASPAANGSHDSLDLLPRCELAGPAGG